MAKFGETLRRLREAKHLTVRDFAEKAGVDPGTVVRAEKLASSNVNQSTFRCFADALGLTPEQLDQKWRPTGPRVETKGGDGIPVINRAPAGAVIDYHEIGADSGQGQFYIDRGSVKDPDAFAVIVTGDSMTGQLDDGDYAVFVPIDPDGRLHNAAYNVEDGQTVFVRFGQKHRKEGCCIASVYRLKDGRIELRKRNPKYAPMILLPEDIDQMGLLVESRKVWVKGLRLDRPAYENAGATKAKAIRPDAADDRPQTHPDYDHG